MEKCSRCGKEGVLFRDINSRHPDKWGVECPKCGKTVRGFSAENAVENWNLWQRGDR